MSINYNGVEYGVVRNGQNDVIALIDGSGTVVVEYSYSSYGEILSITGSMAATLGEANPFRYRGYIFDNESGFYYLQSRYYDPQVGRFINADDTTILDGGSDHLLENNLFVYCFNNPINKSDEGGFWADPVNENRGNTNSTFKAGMIIAIIGIAFLASVPTGGGSLVFAGGVISATAVSTIGTGLAVGGLALSGSSLMMKASNGTPRNNQKQNKQFNDAMNDLKIKDKDIREKIHRKISKKGLTYKGIIKFAKEMLKME